MSRRSRNRILTAANCPSLALLRRTFNDKIYRLALDARNGHDGDEGMWRVVSRYVNADGLSSLKEQAAAAEAERRARR